MTPEETSGPGWARFDANDNEESVERKMADALAPLGAMLEAYRRVFGDEEADKEAEADNG